MTDKLRRRDKFDYGEMGANIGTYCPLLDAICACEIEQADRCPWNPVGGCPDEGDFDFIITEKGFVVPDPLEEVIA